MGRRTDVLRDRGYGREQKALFLGKFKCNIHKRGTPNSSLPGIRELLSFRERKEKQKEEKEGKLTFPENRY